MRWEDLRQIHRARGGIYVNQGQLVSLLVSDIAYYPNEVGLDRIHYAIPANAGRRVLQAFGSAIREKHGIRVFRKVERGVWEDLGSCKVVSMESQGLSDGREVVFFILKRQPVAKQSRRKLR